MRDGVDALAEIAVERHRGGVGERHAGGGAQIRVAGDGQRAHRHAVEAVGEVDDVASAGDLAGDLQRGFDRVGAGRADELHDVVVQAARLEDDVLHRLEEALLGGGVQVERMGDAVVHDVVDQRALEDIVVVAVVQRAGAGQEVEVAVALRVEQLGALGAGEHGREAAGVGAHVGLQPLEHGGVGLRSGDLGGGAVQHGVLVSRFRGRSSPRP